MDPTHEPRHPAAGPTAPRDLPPDDAVVAYLRARAPGLPTPWLDARTVTSRARRALHRRRLRNSLMAVAAAATAYLALAAAGPVPVPGVGTVSVPGSRELHVAAGVLIPTAPAGPGQWPADVDRIEADVLPVAMNLELTYYLLHPGPCRLLEYRRGKYSDPEPDCSNGAPFDAQALADYQEVTEAVERCGVPIERIRRDHLGIYFPLPDYSWQYNWEYVYLIDTSSSPPGKVFPEEQWTHIRGDWWFHRAHDD